MRAIVYRQGQSAAGFVVEEVEKPHAAAGQVLVAVRAAGVNVLDWYLRRGLRFGSGRGAAPRVGRDLAGVVEAVGTGVTRVKPGDEVLGLGRGAFAEYVVANENLVAAKPANISFQQAAGVGVAGLTALQGLRDAGRLRTGEHVLVNGASGGIGTFMVQIAKAFGAEVTAVCSTRNVDMVRSIGADHVIDYQRTDFTSGSRRYDLIVDIVATGAWLRRASMLTPTGRYVFVGGPPMRGVGMFFVSLFAGRRLNAFITRPRAADLDVLVELMRRGEVMPVVDREYAFGDAGDAVAYVAEGHTRGKVVLIVRGADDERTSDTNTR